MALCDLDLTKLNLIADRIKANAGNAGCYSLDLVEKLPNNGNLTDN
jgi:hypothetical protein